MALGVLKRQISCYRLETGRELGQLPRLLESLLE